MTKEDLMQIKELLDTQKQEILSEMDARFGKVDARFGKMDARIDGLNQRIDDLSQSVDGLSQSVDDLSQSVDELSQTVDELKESVAAVDQRVDEVYLLIENEVMRDIRLLAEGQQDIRRDMVSVKRIEKVEERLDDLEGMSRRHERLIQELREAQ